MIAASDSFLSRITVIEEVQQVPCALFVMVVCFLWVYASSTATLSLLVDSRHVTMSAGVFMVVPPRVLSCVTSAMVCRLSLQHPGV